jgi:K+ transporter
VRWIFPLVFGLCYYAIEGTLLSASVNKVPQGGWFSLMMAGIYSYVMCLWFWGYTRKTRQVPSVCPPQSCFQARKLRQAGADY